MAEFVADRFAWAAGLMSIGPSDTILEIGCGQGAAASFICKSLSDGTIVAIDRSEKMICAAEKRNQIRAMPALSSSK